MLWISRTKDPLISYANNMLIASILFRLKIKINEGMIVNFIIWKEIKIK